MIQPPTRSRRSMMVGFASVLIGSLMLGNASGALPSVAVAQDDSGLRPVGVVAEPDDALNASLADCTDVAALDPGVLAEAGDGETAYVIDSDVSEARYVVEEELAGIGANTAIGRTSAFIGQILLDADGTPVACSRFDVDMRTLVSDESRRDNFLRGNTLQSDTYPVATFVLRAVEGLEGPLTPDEQTFTLVGDLVFRGETKLVAWEATARLEGDALTGTAHTEFLLADYNIEKPIVGSVVSIADDLRLEVDIEAAPVA